jgi:membrane peptidoglycan carboxypeptidase
VAAARTNPNPGIVLVKLIGTLLVAGVLGAGVLLPYVGGVGLAGKHLADQFLNTKCHLVESPPPEKTELYANDGQTLIATIFRQDRQPIPLSQIRKPLQTALIDTEDRRFYQHHGVDLRGLIRSAINTSSGDTQGGSTLTMQYVKQIRYYQAGDNKQKQAAAIAQTLQRKMEDAKCALYIENVKHESKPQILDNYLNIAFFGENSYGIETAAETYFGKTATQLSLAESAMLVGLLRAPTQYDPFLNPQAARDRRNQVLQNMVTNNNLTQIRANRLKATPISLATTAPPLVKEGCANAAGSITNVGYFCDYAVNWLLSHKVVTQAQLQTGGLKITTTLDANLQDSMQNQLSQKLSTHDNMSAIMPVVDPHTGNILAMATSKKYGNGKHGTTTLPIFTSYTAQAASTYKLFPLLAALSTGVSPSWELQTPNPFLKYPWHHCSPQSNGNVQNGDANETFRHNESLATATAKSSNTYFTGIADQLFMCILNPITDMADSLGMKSLAQPSGDPGPDGKLTVQDSILKYSSAKRLVLGDIATSPLELTSAYATIANDGVYNSPAPIESIKDSDGKSIAVPRTQAQRVVAPQVARQAVQILTGDTRTEGTTIGTSATQFAPWYANHSSDIAGKTGTAPGLDRKTGKSNKNGALWFVGMTPNLVATTALIDLDHPSWAASGLPGVKDAADRAYGAYAAGVWLKTMQPTIRKKTWTWPTADSVPGSTVPDVRGMTLDEAKSELKNNHYKMRQLDAADLLMCTSRQYTNGEVAYYAPQTAPHGATITVCPASGEHQDIWTPPPPPPPPPTSGPPSGSSGSSSSSPPPGGSSSSSPPAPPTSSSPPPGGGSSPGGVVPTPPGGGGGRH